MHALNCNGYSDNYQDIQGNTYIHSRRNRLHLSVHGLTSDVTSILGYVGARKSAACAEVQDKAAQKQMG